MVKAKKIDMKKAIAFGKRNKANAKGVGRGLQKKKLSARVLKQYTEKVEKLVGFAEGLK